MKRDPQPLKKFTSLPVGERPWPLIRTRVLCDGWPSGVLHAVVKDRENPFYLYVPAAGNPAWSDAATDVRILIDRVRWIDDRMLTFWVRLEIDAYLVGNTTPAQLLINDSYANPCGIVHFAERHIDESGWDTTGFHDVTSANTHNYSIVFDHVGDEKV